MKLGLVQQANSSDRAANIEKLKQNIRACALQGAELVVLQELHNGLYFCQTENTEVFDQAEPIPGPSTEGFGALAKELGISVITTTRAYNELEGEGYIVSRQGKGSIVLGKNNSVVKSQYRRRMEESLELLIENARYLEMSEEEIVKCVEERLRR